eukprot:6997716-Prymnesium_polylepis.1
MLRVTEANEAELQASCADPPPPPPGKGPLPASERNLPPPPQLVYRTSSEICLRPRPYTAA